MLVRLIPCVLVLPPAALAQGAPPWFTEITTEVGLDFVHESAALGGLHMPEIMGAGCAFWDFDGDDDLDLYFTNGSFELSDPEGRGRSVDRPRDRVFRREPDGRYTDATEGSGLGNDGYGMGMAVGDYDGDGRPDLFVTNFGPDRLYRNLGGGRFADVTEAAGVAGEGWSCSTAFVDFDADGDLDLFVTRYVAFDPGKTCTDASGRADYCGPKESPPVPDVLFRNEGNGTFTDVSAASGVAGASAAGLGVTCEDFDGDGRLDIYVANDAYANHLWLNEGDGTFVDDALLLGAAFNQQGMAEAGMGIVAADLDGDADLDVFITHLRNESDTIFSWDGPDLGFTDCSAERGIVAVSMPTTGFGTVALDVELDGDLDLFVANGSVNRGDPWPGAEVPSPWDRYAEPNTLWLNDGKGFVLAGDEGGTLTRRVEVSRGAAAGDV
ncbi:MAG: FG-GAP repeat domain-containing protein, partial [bacterium]